MKPHFRSLADSASLATPIHALTVDAEDWPQSTLNHDLPITQRAVRNTHALLNLFAKHSVRGTFFVLGLLAEKCPSLVREIADAGHEIASHGYSHKPVFQIGPQAFVDEIRRSRAQLEDLSGQAVVGYRAPDFSITGQSLWALDLLAQEGYEYDSSVMPVKMRRYGIDNFPTTIHRLPNGLVEAPLSTVQLAGRRWPVAGGGYFRLLPGRVTAQAIYQLQKQHIPAIVYLHPYEIDPDELTESSLPIPFTTRLTQSLGRTRVAPRLSALFRRFLFAPLGEVIAMQRLPQADNDDNAPAAHVKAGSLQPVSV